MFTVDMTTASDIAVVDGIEANGALELVFELIGADAKGVVI